jgi:PAS domain S-box-containing protein
MRLKLALKMPLLVVGATLAAGIGVALLDYRQAAQDAYRAAQDRLAAVLQARVEALADYRGQLQRDLQAQAASPFVVEAAERLALAWRDLGPEAATLLRGAYVERNPFPAPERSRLTEAAGTAAYGEAHRELHGQLRHWTERYGYRDLLLIDLDGNVVYSVRKQSDFGVNLNAPPARDGALAGAFREATAHIASGKQAFTDFARYPPAGDEPTGFAADAIFDAQGRPIGVLALELSLDRVNAIMRASTGLGRAGETMLLGQDLRLRAGSALDAAFLRPVAIDVLSRAAQGEAAVSVGRDEGRELLVAYAPIELMGMRWVVAVGANLAEVYAPIEAMRNRALLNGVGLAALVALIGFAATRMLVVRPLGQVMRAVRLLASGGHSAPVALPPRADEIGDLGRALSLLRDSLIERDALAAERQREALLIESARRFRTISETLAVAVVVADGGDGAIRYANPAALGMLHLAPKLPGQTRLGDFVATPGAAGRMVDLALKGGQYQARAELRRADGSSFPGEVSARFLEFDGDPCAVISIIDLSQQVEAQTEIERQRERIHQAEKLGALGSLLAGVAHELNNPLSVVVAQANLLEETVENPEILQRSGRIRAAADRCARIVRTFLAMTRQRPPTRSAVDVNQAVASTLELVAYPLRTAGIEVIRELGSGLPLVWADADQLGQVLTNLMVNAQQAMSNWDGPRRLVVATAIEGDGATLRIVVRDSGPGVPPEIKSRIFEPFFTTKPVGVGTGIGLSLCHGILAAHGGSIQLEDAPGGGASFVVRLPVGARAPAGAATLPAPLARVPGRQLLIVDDERDVGESLAEILRAAGHAATIVDSGAKALELLKGGARVDLVLSDVRMPDLDGPALYRRVVAMRPELAARFIMVTGDTLSQSVRDFLEETNLPCLEKPFNVVEVRQMVTEIADRASGALPRVAVA